MKFETELIGYKKKFVLNNDVMYKKIIIYNLELFGNMIHFNQIKSINLLTCGKHFLITPLKMTIF